MSTKKLTCKSCIQDFEIPKKEYTRQTKKGRPPDHFFCSLSCNAAWAHKNVDGYGWQGSEKQLNHLKDLTHSHIARGKKPFNYYLNRMASRRNMKDRKFYNLDEDYLSTLWEQQKYRCAITNIPITLHTHIGAGKFTNITPTTASLDRIDSSQGYIKGNVQFVAYSVNLAKNSFPQEEILKFFDTVRDQSS